MEFKKGLVCIPENDGTKRFAIGEIGERNLLCIGINPNTANINNLDPTSRNVKKIALINGYDGWILVNLYPKRTKEVSLLDKKPDNKLFMDNLDLISEIGKNNNLRLDKVWVAWGNEIDSLHHTYLKLSALHIFKNLSEFDLKFVSIGTNISGNPTHPSPQAIASKYGKNSKDIKLVEFDYKKYLTQFDII